MKCPIQKENEKLRKEIGGLEEQIRLLKDKIYELMRNSGKDKNEDRQE